MGANCTVIFFVSQASGSKPRSPEKHKKRKKKEKKTETNKQQKGLFCRLRIIGRKDKRTNNKTMRLDTKNKQANNGAASYQSLVKIELMLRIGAGLLSG